MTAAVRPPRIGGLLRVAAVAAAVLTIAAGAATVGAAVGPDAGRPDLVDFHEVYLAGKLAREGRLAEAYDPAAMAALQREVGGRDTFLPFGYPPPFALLLSPLSRLPLVPAFVGFDVATLALFVAVLHRLAGGWFWPALLATSPAVLVDLKIGQNGLLTAGLAGASVAALLGGRQIPGGLAAGALGALKPHLAATLPILMLVRPAWRALAASALGCAALWGAALALFGTDSGSAFVASLGFAGRFMAAGAFPLHRMASVYATALSLGVAPAAALAIQGATALAVLGTTIAVARRLDDARVTAGLLLAATVTLSPYLYDYDLTLLGAGLALVVPALARRLAQRSLVVLLAAVAGVESLGLLQTAWSRLSSTAGPSLMGPGVLACLAAVLLALGRPVRAFADAGAQAEPGICR